MGNKIVFDGRIIDLDDKSKEELENLEKTLLKKEEELTKELNKKLHIEEENNEG